LQLVTIKRNETHRGIILHWWFFIDKIVYAESEYRDIYVFETELSGDLDDEGQMRLTKSKETTTFCNWLFLLALQMCKKKS
jgi:hypothetical protein